LYFIQGELLHMRITQKEDDWNAAIFIRNKAIVAGL
jgi:hypothetical protein